jgi:hypothetical protein
LHSTFACLSFEKLGAPWKILADLKILAQNFGTSQNLGGLENSDGKLWHLTKFRRI